MESGFPGGQGTLLLLGCSPSPSPVGLGSHKSTPCRWEEKAVLTGGFQPSLRAAAPWGVPGVFLGCHLFPPQANPSEICRGCSPGAPVPACGSRLSVLSTAWLGRHKILGISVIFPSKSWFGGCVSAPGWGSCSCNLEGVWLWGIELLIPVRAPREGDGVGRGCWAQKLVGSAGQG